MSFRKKNVRPNLSSSKRSTPSASPSPSPVPLSFKQMVAEEAAADNAKEDADAENKEGSEAAAPQVNECNSTPTNAQLPDNLSCENLDKKLSSESSASGKRLSKRTKVAPKVSLSKQTRRSVATSNENSSQQSPSESPSQSLTQTPTDTPTPTPQKSPLHSPPKSPSNVSLSSSNTPSVNVLQSTDGLLTPGASLLGTNDSSATYSSPPNKDTTSDVLATVSPPLTSTQKCSSSPYSFNRDVSGEGQIDVMKAYQLIRDGNISQIDRDIDKDIEHDEEHSARCEVSGELSIGETPKLECSKSNKLSKRSKVIPKLSSRSLSSPRIDLETRLNDAEASCSKTVLAGDADECSATARAGSVSLLEPMGANFNDLANDNGEDTSRRLSDDSNLSASSFFKDVVDVIVATSVDDETMSDKRELKQVRFTPNHVDDEYENNENNENDDDNDSSCIGFPSSADMTNTSVSTCSPGKSILRCGSNDEESMSDGETLGKQLESKNKVFKPNLGTKRRERLSSFSAYSSCDEDDWPTQKRKKKVAKNSDEGKTKKSDEKKSKGKSAEIKKKDRENLEPNAGAKKEKKERKKRYKSNAPGGGCKRFIIEEGQDISTLTMQELIHGTSASFKTVGLRSRREEDENERVLDPPADTSATLIPKKAPPSPDKKPDSKDTECAEEVMAPQIMINEDGQIVINQESLTISQTADDTALKKSAVIYEDALSYGNHLRRKHNSGKRWSIEETLRFYKALSEIGTDFTLMSQAFGRFTRNELKKKFKKEEKVNCDLVDRALSNRLPLNMEMFLRGKEEMKEAEAEAEAEAAAAEAAAAAEHCGEGDAVVPDTSEAPVDEQPKEPVDGSNREEEEEEDEPVRSLFNMES